MISMRLAYNQAKEDPSMSLIVLRLIRKLENFDLVKFRKVLCRCISISGMPDNGKFSAERADFVYRLTERRVEMALDALYGKH